MLRHISLFRLKEEHRTPQTLGRICARLSALPKEVPTIVACEVGTSLRPGGGASPDGAVEFYDVVQILTFSTREDLEGYPATQGHRAFLEATSACMDRVKAIDYEVTL